MDTQISPTAVALLETVTLPTLSINGTSKAELLNIQTTCMVALRDAQKAVQAALIHARDFQYAPERFAVAREETVAELTLLERMVERHTTLALHIQGE